MSGARLSTKRRAHATSNFTLNVNINYGNDNIILNETTTATVFASLFSIHSMPAPSLAATATENESHIIHLSETVFLILHVNDWRKMEVTKFARQTREMPKERTKTNISALFRDGKCYDELDELADACSHFFEFETHLNVSFLLIWSIFQVSVPSISSFKAHISQSNRKTKTKHKNQKKKKIKWNHVRACAQVMTMSIWVMLLDFLFIHHHQRTRPIQWQKKMRGKKRIEKRSVMR